LKEGALHLRSLYRQVAAPDEGAGCVGIALPLSQYSVVDTDDFGRESFHFLQLRTALQEQKIHTGRREAPDLFRDLVCGSDESRT
jgi:hypothetical protein